jgi:hypothetical protein
MHLIKDIPEERFFAIFFRWYNQWFSGGTTSDSQVVQPVVFRWYNQWFSGGTTSGFQVVQPVIFRWYNQ